MSSRVFRRYTAAAAAAVLAVCVPVHSVPALDTAEALPAADTALAAAAVSVQASGKLPTAGTVSNIGPVLRESPEADWEPISEEDPDANREPDSGEGPEADWEPILGEDPEADWEPDSGEDPDANWESVSGEGPSSEKDLSPVTTTVEQGTLSVIAPQVSARLQFFDWGAIWFDTGYTSAVFVRYCVEEGDHVEKGQPIAEFRAQVNEIDIEAAKLRLTRALEEQEEIHEACDARLAAAEKAVNESTGTARRIAELDLEKCRMETERSCRSVDERVTALEEQLAEYEEAQEKLLLPSPMTGYISSLETMEAGKIVWNGDSLGMMYGRKEQTYEVTDLTGVLCYGMQAQFVEKGGGSTARGMVVSCSQKYLSSAFQTDKAYIRFDSRAADEYYATISYESLHLENVLIVSLEAVKTDSYGSYVTELKDGRKIKRYFLMGKRTKDYCHVLDGLTEGMVVVIN